MVSKFNSYVEENQLFDRDSKLLLGVSGGSDSILLAHLLYIGGYNFEMAHCNFCLRGDESDRDASFVQEIANQYKVGFHLKIFDTKTICDREKISVQMAARKLRYDWFDDLCIKNNFDFILTAHHLDDSIETFFINLLRGTGIKGLLGINPIRGKIIRPLLFLSKKKILNYIKEYQLEYREDASNKEEKYLRNKIRNSLIPILKEINPSYKSTILTDIQYLNHFYKIYNQRIDRVKKILLEETKDGWKINIKVLQSYTPISTYLYELLLPFGHFDISAIVDCLESQSGKTFYSSSNKIILNRGELLIIPHLKDIEDMFFIGESDKQLDDPLRMRLSLTNNLIIDPENNSAFFDFEKLKFPLILRKWREGDRFKPLGMQNFKKVSDFFIDKKYSLLQKNQAWILCSQEDIIWIVGSRIDERFKVTEKTKKMYIATVFD